VPTTGAATPHDDQAGTRCRLGWHAHDLLRRRRHRHDLRLTPDTSDEDARAYWLGPGISTYVAVDAEDVDAEGRILGNTAAVRLWRKLGFIIVGTLPNAFRHEDLGLVDVYSMYRSLDDITP
jgi:hypothetical protein